MRILILFLILFTTTATLAQNKEAAGIIILGVAQDGGYPHMGCSKECCNKAWANDTNKKYVVSLALVDPIVKKWWLFEATPDIREQLHNFRQLTNGAYSYLPDGIFLTHAHIGHYTGLMQLGREVMNTHLIPVYTLPKMKTYLETNGPWSQLVKLENIRLVSLMSDSTLELPDGIDIKAFTVPHRDEYSETAGFSISTPGKKYLFIPDINKWDKWHRSIVDEINKVDIALVDGTFYDGNELPGRKMSEVPHPFVIESMELLNKVKSKTWFIHLNHTNPLLWDASKQNDFLKTGYHLARQGQQL